MLKVTVSSNTEQLQASFLQAVDEALEAVVWAHCGPDTTFRVLGNTTRLPRNPEHSESESSEEPEGK